MPQPKKHPTPGPPPDLFASCLVINRGGFRKAPRQHLRVTSHDTRAMPAVAAGGTYYLLTEPQVRELHLESGKVLKKWARSTRLLALGPMPASLP